LITFAFCLTSSFVPQKNSWKNDPSNVQGVEHRRKLTVAWVTSIPPRCRCVQITRNFAHLRGIYPQMTGILSKVYPEQGCKKIRNTPFLCSNPLLAFPRLVSRQRRRPVVQEHIGLLRRRLCLAHFGKLLIYPQMSTSVAWALCRKWNSHVGSFSM
jgi:hypothetical protein